MANLTVRALINTLSIEVLQSIIESYEKYEKQGFIGDEPIREYSEMIMTEWNLSDSYTTIIMKEVVFECYRQLYIKLNNHSK